MDLPSDSSSAADTPIRAAKIEHADRQQQQERQQAEQGGEDHQSTPCAGGCAVSRCPPRDSRHHPTTACSATEASPTGRLR